MRENSITLRQLLNSNRRLVCLITTNYAGLLNLQCFDLKTLLTAIY